MSQENQTKAKRKRVNYGVDGPTFATAWNKNGGNIQAVSKELKMPENTVKTRFKAYRKLGASSLVDIAASSSNRRKTDISAINAAAEAAKQSS